MVVAANALARRQPGTRLVHDRRDEDRPRRPQAPRASRSGSTRPPATAASRSPPGVSGWLAATSPRATSWSSGQRRSRSRVSLISALFVRDTGAHVALEQRESRHARARTHRRLREAFAAASWRPGPLRSYSQAGLVNNLNDALAWGLVPLYLAANGAERRGDRPRRRHLPGGLGHRRRSAPAPGQTASGASR